MAEINATLTKVDADLIIRALDTKSGGSTLDSGLKLKRGLRRAEIGDKLMANQTEKKQIDNVGSSKQLDTSGTHSRPHVLQGIDSGKRVGMGAPEHAPARCKRSLEQFLCLSVVPLDSEH